ncbi:PLAT/LH2 domain-containing protein [Leptospira ilyithenensis]|uniref:PLAT/LH2 domain-containing protein n=1 Tax=Leptospira ilyithenensis TaxID=2484901 RepID=UPI00143838FC|nr:PLAT/LH2 domain-containing protein [Leptospira ilyithenensis]
MKVKDKKDAGADGFKLYIILFGKTHSTNQFRLDNKNKDDFKRGKTSTFTFDASENLIGLDVGVPYAITLTHIDGNNKDSSDALYLDEVEVEYSATYENEDKAEKPIVVKFPFNGAIGKKGDFDLNFDWTVMTKCAEGFELSNKELSLIKNIDTLYVILDNRQGSEPMSLTQTEKYTYSIDSFLGKGKEVEEENNYSFSMGKDGGWFGVDYKFSVDIKTKTTTKTVEESRMTIVTEKDFDFTTNANQNQLAIYEFPISVKKEAFTHKIGDLVLEVIKGVSNLSMPTASKIMRTYGKNADLSLKDKILYKQITGSDFEIITG